jgi:Integrase core domain
MAASLHHGRGVDKTGRFGAKDTEVLFDRICRENGIDHLLTAPRSPTTTGKERFHRTLRSEFLTGRVFEDLSSAQSELDRWVGTYNTDRPHSALSMATPASPTRRLAIFGSRFVPNRPPPIEAQPERWIAGVPAQPDHNDEQSSPADGSGNSSKPNQNRLPSNPAAPIRGP